ncbi:methyl-accepting chemotaxis protein [Ferrimonas sp. YFM]|uniref:methyl-accepting chemotaxis protein n=1 Tax=Ferrimonas sp. YFM TaxID=3028878 RepID=UPI0025739556|nr:methyl-accepting chemotaxis protein [Ferrimonas sp. YFM]BDY05473.1 chemotaxis protein [Ferrimonas sp. YFM]
MSDTYKPSWLERLLISLSLREKFALLAIFPLLGFLIVAGAVFTKVQDELVHAHQMEQQTQVSQLKQILTPLPAEQRQQLVKDLNDVSLIAVSSDRQLAQAARQGESLVQGDEVRTATQLGDQLLVVSEHYVVNDELMRIFQTPMYLIIFVALFCTFWAVAVRRFVMGSMDYMREVMAKACANDLTVRLNFVPGRDDFRPLANAIDALIDTRRNVVLSLRVISDSINQSAHQVLSQMETSSEMAVGQREHLDTLASAMEEMSATVKEVASHAESTADETRQANEQSQHGHHSLQQTITAIESLVSDVHNASAAVNQVHSNAAKIDEVITTINAISEQTNLLALNAAIEAARAGEQGRGFAVVADEVRNLAGRTQEATVEIQTMIEELQTGTQALEQVMTNTVERAEEGRELVSQAGDDLGKITQHSERINSMSAQIATAAEQQTAVANEIAASLTQVRNQSHEVEVAANESRQGCDSLTQTADDLKGKLANLRT